MPSDYAVRNRGFAGCKYVVTHCMELAGEVLVRLESCWSEPAEPCVCTAKRTVLEFRGGHLHGRSLDSQSADTNEALLAVAYYCITDKGTVGQKISARRRMLLLPEPKMIGGEGDDEYGVSQRLEEAEWVLVRFEHCHEARSAS